MNFCVRPGSMTSAMAAHVRLARPCSRQPRGLVSKIAPAALGRTCALTHLPPTASAAPHRRSHCAHPASDYVAGPLSRCSSAPASTTMRLCLGLPRPLGNLVAGIPVSHSPRRSLGTRHSACVARNPTGTTFPTSPRHVTTTLRTLCRLPIVLPPPVRLCPAPEP